MSDTDPIRRPSLPGFRSRVVLNLLDISARGLPAAELPAFREGSGTVARAGVPLFVTLDAVARHLAASRSAAS